jgi:glycerate 2-kinase
MKIVVAPDSWKDCMPSVSVAASMAKGIEAAGVDAEVVVKPMADGGQGTVRALVAATGGDIVREKVTGPLGSPVDAEFGLLGDGATAVVEMAAAAGLELVPIEQRNPLYTTTRGVGELLLAAAHLGVKRIILGIGGSATNDGGAGMLAAIGYFLLDRNGNDIEPTGGGLENLKGIDSRMIDIRLKEISIDVACDVTNPLLGPTGASAVFGPQKGANAEVVATLERNLERFAAVVERDLGRRVADVPGSGAAGGLGFGLLAGTNATLKRGVELVIEATRLEDALADADLCLTGEGSLDGQTAFGKTAVGVARVCRKLGVPCVVIAGSVNPPLDELHAEGVTAFFSAVQRPVDLAEAIRLAPTWISLATEQAVRLFAITASFSSSSLAAGGCKKPPPAAGEVGE